MILRDWLVSIGGDCSRCGQCLTVRVIKVVAADIIGAMSLSSQYLDLDKGEIIRGVVLYIVDPEVKNG